MELGQVMRTFGWNPTEGDLQVIKDVNKFLTWCYLSSILESLKNMFSKWGKKHISSFKLKVGDFLLLDLIGYIFYFFFAENQLFCCLVLKLFVWSFFFSILVLFTSMLGIFFIKTFRGKNTSKTLTKKLENLSQKAISNGLKLSKKFPLWLSVFHETYCWREDVLSSC